MYQVFSFIANINAFSVGFFLFLVIILLLLYCKANPISLIPVVLLLFLFSAFFSGILGESFSSSSSSDCRLFQSSLKFV